MGIGSSGEELRERPGRGAGAEGGKAQRTREGLLAAIAEEIRSVGSFTAERVADRAGTSVATFWSYFSSKEEALTGAFERVLDRLIEVVDEGLSIEALLEQGAEARAHAFTRAALLYFERESRIFRVALAAMPESEALRATYRSHQDDAFARYRRFVELGQSAGKIRSGDPETIARTLLVVTQGFNNPMALGLPEEAPLALELGEVVRRVVEKRVPSAHT